METKGLREFAKGEIDFAKTEEGLKSSAKKAKERAKKVGGKVVKGLKWLTAESEVVTFIVDEAIGDFNSFTINVSEFNSDETKEAMKFFDIHDASTIVGFCSEQNLHRYTEMIKLVASPQWQKVSKSEIYPDNVCYGLLKNKRGTEKIKVAFSFFDDGNLVPIATFITKNPEDAAKLHDIMNNSIFV